MDEKKGTLVLVIDAQNDFVTGALGTKEAQETVPFIVDFVKRAHERGWSVWYTQDTHPDGGLYFETLEGKKLPIEHCIKGTKGCRIIDELTKIEICTLESKILKKTGFGYPYWFSKELDKIYDKVIILGFCTDICVITNALMLRGIYPNLPITVMMKGCAGTTKEMHYRALSVMKSCQIDICEEDDVE